MHELSLPQGCEIRCPACRHRGLGPLQSLERKHRFLEEVLRAPVRPVRSVPEGGRLGYRERTCLHARLQEGRWAFGMLRSVGRSAELKEEFVPIPQCPVHSERVRAVFEFLARNLPTHETIRFPLVYAAVSGNLLALVIKWDRRQALDAGLLETLSGLDWGASGLEGVHLNFNASAGRRVFASGGWERLWGAALTRTDSGLWHGVQAFQQLIPELYEESLDEAMRHLRPGPGGAVLDLYSGIGASILRWGDVPVLGVELGGEAIECARLNLSSAVGVRVEVLRGKCSDRIPQMDEWVRRQTVEGRELLAYVNPPRTGLEPEVLRWLGGLGALTRLAYLSCSPGTLSRDLEQLQEQGLRTVELIPFDFFPQTHHVETLALLERKATGHA